MNNLKSDCGFRSNKHLKSPDLRQERLLVSVLDALQIRQGHVLQIRLWEGKEIIFYQ